MPCKNCGKSGHNVRTCPSGKCAPAAKYQPPSWEAELERRTNAIRERIGEDAFRDLEWYLYANTIRANLASSVPTWPTEEMKYVVFRGQPNDESPNVPGKPFFSTSFKPNKASNFTGDACCLYIIHVMPGVRMLNIVSMNLDEYEVLVETGGVFYQDAAKTARGFRLVAPGEVAEGGAVNQAYEYAGRIKVYEGYYYPAGEGGRRRKQLTRRRQH